MQELLNSIGEAKMLHANVHLKSSERAKEVFETMKNARRTKHIEALKEYENWMETFGEGMKERFEERKKKSNLLKETTDAEVERLIGNMDDKTLLSSDLEYVTYVWDKILDIKKQRKEELESYFLFSLFSLSLLSVLLTLSL